MRLTRDTRVTALLLAPAGLFLGAWFLLPLAQLFRLSLGAREGPLHAYREVLGSAVYQRVSSTRWWWRSS